MRYWKFNFTSLHSILKILFCFSLENVCVLADKVRAASIFYRIDLTKEKFQLIRLGRIKTIKS